MNSRSLHEKCSSRCLQQLTDSHFTPECLFELVMLSSKLSMMLSVPPLREKCLNTTPNTGRCRPEKTPYLYIFCRVLQWDRMTWSSNYVRPHYKPFWSLSRSYPGSFFSFLLFLITLNLLKFGSFSLEISVYKFFYSYKIRFSVGLDNRRTFQQSFQLSSQRLIGHDMGLKTPMTLPLCGGSVLISTALLSTAHAAIFVV